MKLTLLYHTCTDWEDRWKKLEKRRNLWFWILIAAVLATFVLLSVTASADFDDDFPVTGHAQIAAHRAGGNLANENTVHALNKAVAHHAAAGEIDVQRTKDGACIINHDSTFKRCCGESIATDENIRKVNDAGKQSGVWTVNTSASLMDFLMSDVDWIITDEVPLAARAREVLVGQSGEVHVLERILRWV